MSLDLGESIRAQFGAAAANYAVSGVHSGGPNLDAMLERAALRGTERVLDVGCGAGHTALAFAPHARDVIALDMTEEMLEQTARLAAQRGLGNVALQKGLAEALPFPDGFFDRVLHVGGINAYADPARALAEMARVARPGTPIVVGDEQLDEVAARSWYQWLTFHWITALDRVHRAPVDAVPVGAQDLRVTQASSFFYAMSFRMPARA